MLSQTVEYALRAIVFLADGEESSFTTQEIAQTTCVPAGYLSKVLQSLGKAGLVSSRRGLHGGFSLAHSAGKITILDVVNAVDPIKRITTCPLKLKSHGTQLCPLHRKLDDAMAKIEKVYGDTSISTLLATDTGSKPLCEA